MENIAGYAFGSTLNIESSSQNNPDFLGTQTNNHVAIGHMSMSEWGTNNVVVGANSDIGLTKSCSAIGTNNYIPDYATNCHVFGNNIKLTSSDLLKDVIYLGNKDISVLASLGSFMGSRFDTLENRIQKLYKSMDLNDETVLIANKMGDYIDVRAKLVELEQRLSYLEEKQSFLKF